jgi:peptidylprolyl isomerase
VRRTVLLTGLALALALSATSTAFAARLGLDDVAVSGAFGEKPTVTFETPFAVKSSVSDERAKGTGTQAVKGSQLVIDYVVLNGRTGAEIEASYGGNPATFVLRKGSTDAIVDGLKGTSPGSRVVIAVAPKDGLTEGGESVGIKKKDTLLFVVDVKDVQLRTPALDRAEGTSVTPPAGLPKVALAKKGKPTITMPKSDAPTSLVAQPLIEGRGELVRAGQTITVHYTGAIWKNGKVFDSSWSRGEPVEFAIGVGQVIAGWDEGLVGLPVGSQVLLVIPPDKGYGASGQPQAGIAGTDTLVFVVDILAAT